MFGSVLEHELHRMRRTKRGTTNLKRSAREIRLPVARAVSKIYFSRLSKLDRDEL